MPVSERIRLCARFPVKRAARALILRAGQPHTRLRAEMRAAGILSCPDSDKAVFRLIRGSKGNFSR